MYAFRLLDTSAGPVLVHFIHFEDWEADVCFFEDGWSTSQHRHSFDLDWDEFVRVLGTHAVPESEARLLAEALQSEAEAKERETGPIATSGEWIGCAVVLVAVLLMLLGLVSVIRWLW